MNQVLLIGLLVGSVNAERMTQRAESRVSAKGNSMIAKVIEMLGDEKDKIKADLGAEAKTMAEYTQWCDDTITELSYGIKSAKAKIGDLTATIEDNGAQITALDEELAELGNEIAARTSEMEEAIAIREKEHNTFLKAEEEQTAAVTELEELSVALKKQISAFAQTPPPVEEGDEALLQQGSASPAATFDAFLQIASKTKDADEAAKQAKFAQMQKVMTRVVNAFWMDGQSKQDAEELQKTALVQEDQGQEPDAMASQTAQNEKNLAAFEGLKGKAEESLQRLRDEETKKASEHNIQVMSLKQAIALAENNVDDAKKEKARLSTEKAEDRKSVV